MDFLSFSMEQSSPKKNNWLSYSVITKIKTLKSIEVASTFERMQKANVVSALIGDYKEKELINNN